MNQTQDTLLFIFGTLKRGFPNFIHNCGILLDANCQTLLAFPLYLVAARYSPWLIDQPGRGTTVCGELYRVTEQQMTVMDQLERIDQTDGYRRKTIEVKTSDQQVLEAFCYLKPPGQLLQADVRLGPLSTYSLQHAALYHSRAINPASI